MPNAQDVLWFKTEFQPRIEAQVAGTPFSVDMLTAFACQETGGIWPVLRRSGLPTARVLELCVGDTIDASPTGGGRRAFPRNKAELVAAPDGDRMFELARQGLVDMAEHIKDYRGAAARPDKFCHGFGIFQLDLQFFKSEPEYFLERRYADFDAALARCVGELKAAVKRLGWQAKTSLSDAEMAGVAIAYNTGRYDPARGLKQGYFDGTKYYGENYFDYLRLAKGVQVAELTPASRGAPRSAKKAVAPRPSATKKSATKRAVTKKVAASTAVKKEVVAKNAGAKKTVAKKVGAKKVGAKKAGAKKAVAKKPGAKKAAVKKGGAKKTSANKSARSAAAARR